MLLNPNSSQLNDALLSILEQNPGLSNVLLADGTRTAQSVTQIMEPVLSAHTRCQITKYYIQAVCIDYEVFLTTNLHAEANIYATHTASSWLIGRGSTCAIHISEPSVSRRHAVIGYHLQDGFFIMDLGSRNGTRVNQTPLVGRARQGLQDGALIQMGNLRLEFFTTARPQTHRVIEAGDYITEVGQPFPPLNR